MAHDASSVRRRGAPPVGRPDAWPTGLNDAPHVPHPRAITMAGNGRSRRRPSAGSLSRENRVVDHA